MNKIFALVVLGAASFSAQAECSITSMRDGSVASAFNKHGGWNFDAKKYHALCEKLRKSRARIHMQGMASVLSDRSVGWATLSLLDADTGVGTSSFASMNTVVNTYASQDKAEQLMVQAINAAAAEWSDIDKALAALEAERKLARAAR